MRRFAQLFAGRTDVYGLYVLHGKTRGNGKVEGHGITKHAPLTEAQWEDHLTGRKMLGVVPIRLDGTVGWFAGDIDVYDIDHSALIQKCQSLEIPVVICRSKSGGAHLYCFVDGSIPAEQAIQLMRAWVTLLGYPKCEVFPKQDHIANPDEDSGNWINLPYFGGNAAERYAYGMGGERLSVSEFEQLGSAMSARPDELMEMLQGLQKPKQNKKKNDPLEDAPPCIATMFDEKVGEGGRNNVLTHIGIYYAKADTDNWRELTTAANYQVFEDPLPIAEVNQIVKNVAKNKYEYLCKLEPMCSLCDKETCLTKKWGVGPQRGIDYDKHDIDRIVKINSDPPVYCVVINGTTVKMSTDQLLSPPKFRRRVYEIMGLLLPPMKERSHEARIKSAKIEVEEAPNEVSIYGQVIEAFEQWSEIHLPTSRSVDEIARGNPFYDREQRVIVFRSSDLIAAFKRSKKFNVSDRDVWVALRDCGCRRENRWVQGKQTKVWEYPVDKPWFDIPDSESF